MEDGAVPARPWSLPLPLAGSLRILGTMSERKRTEMISGEKSPAAGQPSRAIASRPGLCYT